MVTANDFINKYIYELEKIRSELEKNPLNKKFISLKDEMQKVLAKKRESYVSSLHEPNLVILAKGVIAWVSIFRILLLQRGSNLKDG